MFVVKMMHSSSMTDKAKEEVGPQLQADCTASKLHGALTR